MQVTFSEAARARLGDRPTSAGAKEPYAAAWFPGEGDVSDDNPFNRLHVDLAWRDQSYLFSLDLEIFSI